MFQADKESVELVSDIVRFSYDMVLQGRGDIHRIDIPEGHRLDSGKLRV